MENKMTQEKLNDLSDGLVFATLLAKKRLFESLEFNQNLNKYVEHPSVELMRYAHENEQEALELTYQLNQLVKIFEEIAA